MCYSQRCSSWQVIISALSILDAPTIPTMEETGLGNVDYTSVINSIQSSSSSRSHYAKYSSNDRYEIGKFASETGDAAAVRKYQKKFGKLNESTVRGFRKKYQQKVLTSNGSISPTKAFKTQKRGRKLKLGNDLDESVQKFIMALRNRGGQVTFAIALATAKALIDRSNDVAIRSTKVGKAWAQSLFRRMGFKKTSCNNW